MAWHGGLSNFCWPLLNDLWVGSPDHIPWRIKSTQSTQPYFNICIYIFISWILVLYHNLMLFARRVLQICTYYIDTYIFHILYIFIYSIMFCNMAFSVLLKPQICTTFAGRVRSSTFVLHYGEAGHGGLLKSNTGGIRSYGWWKKSCIIWDTPKGLDTGIKPTFRAF